jgi:hypothetical protein
MQITRTFYTLCRSLAAIAAVIFTSSAFAANYPLEITNIKPAGVDGMSQNNRIFWAYPGIEYNIRTAVIGGQYPFTFSLRNGPTGMTINSRTGEISWTNPPNGSTATPTISVTDTEGSTVSTSWTINVNPSRFIFIDAVNGREFDATNPGTGTLTNPFRRIRDLYQGNVYASKTLDAHVNKIAYFRTGTYYIDGYLENVQEISLGRMAMLDTYKPVAWLAYPGEVPTIDGQCFATSPQIGSRPCNRSAQVIFYGSSNNTYIDGFRVTNFAVHAFRVDGSGNYQTFRRNTFSRLGPTECCVNESWIMTMYSGDHIIMGSYMTIQDNVFEDIDRGSCIKLYSVQKILIEDNTCRNGFDSTGGNDTEGIAIKGGRMSRVTVRHNIVDNVVQKGIGGNMNVLDSAEILFNRVYNARDNAIDINQDSMVAGPVHVYRNTIVGQARVREADSSDGPFYFYNNVLINNDGGNGIYYENVTDRSRIQANNNLVSSPSQSIIEPNLNLTPAYASYVGTHGYQTGNTTRYAPPRDLRRQ